MSDNFAERIAYWYLRFNGCMLIENFVHHGVAGGRRAADTDLLAVRLPYSQQRIAGQVLVQDDWAQMFRIDGDARWVALIVQVKGGMAGGAPAQAFTRDRLDDAVRRIGAIPEGSIADLCVRLLGAPYADCGDWVFVKLVIAEAPVEGCFVSLPLREAESFVRNRLRSHIDRKRGDWVQFRDPVIQLLAWEECGRG